MKEFSVATVVLAVLGGIVLTGCSTASGGSTGTAGGPMKMGGGQMPACCQQMMQAMQKGDGQMPACWKEMMAGMNPEKMRQMMGQMKMTPEMMERMQVLMRTPIFLDAPCPIFAQAEKLGLSEEQKKKLGEIENEARAKARAVLTSEQQAKLGNVLDKPVTMMETCPMMKMMQGVQQRPASSAAETEKTK